VPIWARAARRLVNRRSRPGWLQKRGLRPGRVGPRIPGRSSCHRRKCLAPAKRP